MMGKLVSQQQLMDEKIYVAVGRDLGNKSTLVWALLNTGGKEFCIVHVHQPLYRKDKEKVQKILDKYLEICSRMQVRAEKIHIEMETVEKGIIQLISERNVKKLVMGAASDRHYSMRMADLLSIKAIFIRQEAPATCCIWFTCKGYLVYKREAMMGNASTSSDQHSVRSRVSVTPSGRFKIPSGYGNEDDEMDQLAFSEADTSKKEARLEAFKHQEAEKEKSEAIKRAKEWEISYFKELKHRKETEVELKKSRETFEKMRKVSENRITESHMLLKKLQENYNLAIEVLKRAKIDRDELKTQRDIAIIEAEELRKIHVKVSRSEDHREAPQYFICPISLEVMMDPQVAADGFTYEGEAISSWLERGHETSPMTNRKLVHTNLVPNLALRSAIQNGFTHHPLPESEKKHNHSYKFFSISFYELVCL